MSKIHSKKTGFRVTLSTAVSYEVANLLKNEADARGVSISKLIADIVERALTTK